MKHYETRIGRVNKIDGDTSCHHLLRLITFSRTQCGEQKVWEVPTAKSRF